MLMERMGDRPDITLILPAYNEVSAIACTIQEAKKYFEGRRKTYEIVISADGGDGTRELASEMAKSDPALRVLGGVERRGKGYGVRRAVALANGEIIGFADADNKTPIDEFDKFEPWLREGYEIVIGSRGLSGSIVERAQPFYRRLGAQGFALVMHVVVGLGEIPDTQCGFKFFQRRAALDLFGRQKIDGYMFDVEILYLAKRAGYRIAQVPVRWRDDRDSRLALLSGNIRNLIDLFRIRLGRSGSTILFSGAQEPGLSSDRKAQSQ
jgi:dolichyl-phosphate beta-glucosyltransferase